MKSQVANISTLSKKLPNNNSMPIGIREVNGKKELIILIKSTDKFDEIISNKMSLQILRGVVPFKKRSNNYYTSAITISFKDIEFTTFISANNHSEYHNSLTSDFMTIVLTDGSKQETFSVQGLPYDKKIPQNKKKMNKNEEVLVSKFFNILGFEKTQEAINDFYMGKTPFKGKGIDLEKDLLAFTRGT